MTENNVSKNMPDNMDVVVVIDKEKLPEDVRKLLEENLPKDVLYNIDNKPDDKSKDNRLFAIQTGTVVGNIYDGTYKKEEDSYIKKKDMLEQLKLSKDLGGCC